MDRSGNGDGGPGRTPNEGGSRGRPHAGAARLMHSGAGPTTPCALAASQAVALLDGELSEVESAWVKSHLADCPACAGERDALVELRRSVSRALSRPELPATSFERVLERLDAGEVDSLGRAEELERRRPLRPSAGTSPRRLPGIVAGSRRPSRPWMVGAGTGALLAALLAVVALPSGRSTFDWLDAPSVPAGTATVPALTLTGRMPARESRASSPGRSAAPSRPRDGAVAARGPSRSGESHDDLQVPDELRRRPGLFLDMGLVRRLDKLKKMEAVYRDPAAAGGAG